MLKVSMNNIDFGEVAINGFPSYKQIKFSNPNEFTVSVQLSSSSLAVNFQFSNENFSAKKSDFDVFCYNEGFDYVNLAEVFVLEAYQERDIIVWFRADSNIFSHVLAHSPPSVYNGTITLHVIPTTNTPQNSRKSVTSLNDKGTIFLDTPLTSTLVRSDTPQNILLQFCANVYLSLVKVSDSELHVTTAPNKIEYANFTVTNVSTRPLSFIIRNQTMKIKGVNFEIYNVGHMEDPKLDTWFLLNGNSSMDLALVVRTGTGSFLKQQYQVTFQCDNLCNPKNTVLIYVNVHIATELQGDIVSVTSNTLDFGNVYRGAKVLKEIGFLNVDGRDDVTVSLEPILKEKCGGDVALQKEDSSIDEFLVLAQKGIVNIKVQYCPAFDTEQGDETCIKFELYFLACSITSSRKQRIVIRCRAVFFTSKILVTPTEIDFGDCTVGQSKRHTFNLENKSPLPGSVMIQIRSKIIRTEGINQNNFSGRRETNETIHIGPHSMLPVSLQITPQRVNPTYRKQITIVNLCNPTQEKQIINIEANNMAPSDAKLHNDLYLWECHFLKRDVIDQKASDLYAITNVPLLVPYTATSKVSYPLHLKITSTCKEIEAFYLCDISKNSLLETKALELQAIYLFSQLDDAGRSDSCPPEQVARMMKELIPLLSSAITTNEMTLGPYECRTIFALINRSIFSVEPISKEDGLLVTVDGLEIPRFVRLSYKLCSTSFELSGQKTKNFGELSIGTKKTTKMILVNRCRSALFVLVSKSHSVTAGHIRIENSEKQSQFLSLRPFATREIEVTFYPGIKGSFDEKIKLENIFDPQNSVAITLKATVIKADTFDVSPDSWNFGNVTLPALGDASSVRVGMKLTVLNTSKARRQIIIRVEMSNGVSLSDDSFKGAKSSDSLGFRGVNVIVQLDKELSGQRSASTRKIEEKIEHLEQKLKIYQRKKKSEKYNAALKTIESLKKALLGEEVDLNTTEATSNTHDNELSESDDETLPSRTKHPSSLDVLQELLGQGIILPIMNPDESIHITFSMIFSRLSGEPLPSTQTSTINLFLFEAKDKEVNRIVPIDITLVRPAAEGDLHAVPANTLSTVATLPLPPVLPSISLEVCGWDRALSSFMGHPLLILRNCVVNDSTELNLLVKATKDTAIVVLEPKRCGGPVPQSLDARFNFFPRNGPVKANGDLFIMVECTARSVGPQRYFIPVKNLQNPTDVRYIVIELNPAEEEECIVTEPKHLAFRDIITPCDPALLESQLLVIKSRFSCTHALLVRTNKPSQVQFFENYECTVPLENPIKRTFLKEIIRVYVKFIPSFKLTQAAARVIQAGIIVEAITSNREDHYCTIGRAVVRLSVRAGGGALCVPTSRIEIGTIPEDKSSAATSIQIVNPSSVFAIRAEVSAPSLGVCINGSGDGGSSSRCVVTLLPKEERMVPVVLQLPSYGCVEEMVNICNLSCIQDPIRVSISALRPDLSILPLCPSPDGLYHFPITVVEHGADGDFHLHESVSMSMRVRNRGHKDLVVVPHGPSHPLYVSSAAASQMKSATAAGPYPFGCALLGARYTESLTWTLTEIPPLSCAQTQDLTEHRMVTFRITTQVRVAQVVDQAITRRNFFHSHCHLPTVDQCLMLLTFVVPLTMSEGCAEPLITDVGIIGVSENRNGLDYSRYKAAALKDVDSRGGSVESNHAVSPASVCIRLKNLSPYLPLIVRVECPPILHFSKKRLTIPPKQSLEVQGSVMIHQITDPGPFLCQAFFINEFNSGNDMTVSITGQCYKKIFQLAYRGEDNPRETFSFPPLSVNPAAEAPLVLSEVKVALSVFVKQEVKLYCSMKYNPQIEGLLKVQVFHFDATPIGQCFVFPADPAASSLSDSFKKTNSFSVQSTSSANGDLGNSSFCKATPGSVAETAATFGSLALGGNRAVASTTSSTHASITNSQPTALAPIAGGDGRRKPAASSSRTLTLRLRCLLMRHHLTALASEFFGSHRKRQQETAWSFDKIPDLEKRRATFSKNMWIGNLTLSNPLTGDEDYHVYGQLEPFSTFSTPPKAELRPIRLVVSIPPPSRSAAPARVDSTIGRAHLVYAGKLRVANCCQKYTAQLGLLVLFSERMSDPITIEVHGGGGHKAEPTLFTTQEDRGTFRGGNTAPPSLSEVQTIHRFELAPEAEVVLDVLLYSSHLSAAVALGATLTDINTTLNHSFLEQFLAFVIFDENVYCSVCVCRVSVALYDAEDDSEGVLLPLFMKASDTAAAEVPAHHEDDMASVDPQLGPSTSHLADVKAAALRSDELVGPSLQCTAAAEESSAFPVKAAPNPAAPTPTAVSKASMDESTHNPQALLATGSVQSSTAAPLSIAQVLSLKKCSPLAGCVGGYVCAFSIPKDGCPPNDVEVCNNMRDLTVSYTVSIVSQTPLQWLLLLSNSGSLNGGESQPLRLSISSSKVGFFIAYLAIRNDVNPCAVLYLRMSAEVFVPTSGEGLFEVLTSNGQRVTINEAHRVSLGHLYGPGAIRANIALEICNRAEVALEFPIFVVKPFHLKMRPEPDPRAGSGGVMFFKRKGSRVAPRQPQSLQQAHEPSQFVLDDSRVSQTGAEATAAPPNVGAGPAKETPSRAAPFSPPTALSPSPPLSAAVLPLFEGRLIACPFHSVPMQNSQKYIVIDSNSRVRLAFVLSCTELHVPEGYGVQVAADVIIRCKQARDARFIFHATFEVFAPSFKVNRVFKIPTSNTIGWVPVPISNLRDFPQTFYFRSQSPILYVLRGTGSAERDEATVLATHVSLADSASNFATEGADLCMGSGSCPAIPSFAELEVAAKSSDYFIVMLDHKRAAQVLDANNSGEPFLTLCERAFVLNCTNPRERVCIELRMDSLSSRAVGGGGVSTDADLTAGSSGQLSAPYTSFPVMLRTIKAGGRNFGEHFIMHFVQRYVQTLSRYADRLRAIFAYYESRKEEGGGAAAGSANAEDEETSAFLLLDDDDDDDDGEDEREIACSTSKTGRRDSCCSPHHIAVEAGKRTPNDIDSPFAPARDAAQLNKTSTGGDRTQYGSARRILETTTTRELVTPSTARAKVEESLTSGTPVATADSFSIAGIYHPLRQSPHNSRRASGTESIEAFANKAPEPSQTLLASRLEDAFQTGYALSLSVLSSTGGARRRQRAGHPAIGLPLSAWRQLHALLVELVWVVDELVFYSILLRNSRLIEGYCVFLVNVVSNHSVMEVWRAYKRKAPQSFYGDGLLGVFSQYLETIDALPCVTPSVP